MSNENQLVIELPENVTIGECGELQKKMSEMLSASDCLEFNAKSVEKVDTAGMQLIISFILMHKNNKNKGQLNLSEKITSSAKQLGVADLIA